MRIRGTFKNIKDETITVVIYNKNRNDLSDINIDNVDYIKFSDEPVTIEMQNDGDTFETILSTNATINLLSKVWLGAYLYADDLTSIIVNIYKGKDILFAGYVTPNTYNQDYSHEWDTIEINCVDALGILENRRPTDNTDYDKLKSNTNIRTFKYLIQLMNINDKSLNLSNVPQISGSTSQYVETGFDRVINADSSVDYYVIETKVLNINDNTAITTSITRRGKKLTPTYVQSTETCIVDGISHYKKYAYVTINGKSVNTGDWVAGDPTNDMPTVVSTVNTLVGYTSGAMQQPFEFYEYFRVDNVLSNNMISVGASDTIGDLIPLKPDKTSLGSYYYFVKAGTDDLDHETDGETEAYFYKEYAWVHMIINNEAKEFNTGQWRRGGIYIKPEKPTDPKPVG